MYIFYIDDLQIIILFPLITFIGPCSHTHLRFFSITYGPWYNSVCLWSVGLFRNSERKTGFSTSSTQLFK